MNSNKTNNCDKTQNTTFNPDHSRCPSDRCIFCDKTLQETGGMRLACQRLRGVCLSDKYRGGGNKDFPYQSLKLSSEPEIFLVVWGEKSKWTAVAIEKAKNEYLNGKQPWFCQICGERKCRQCGAPINYPMGSDILDDNGCSSHAPIFPFNPGCSNSGCDEYKEWKWSR